MSCALTVRFSPRLSSLELYPRLRTYIVVLRAGYRTSAIDAPRARVLPPNAIDAAMASASLEPKVDKRLKETRSAEPNPSKAEQDSMVLMEEGRNLLATVELYARRAEAIPVEDLRKLAAFDGLFRQAEEKLEELLRRAAAHNAASPPDARADLSACRDRARELILEFRLRHDAAPPRMPEMELPSFDGQYRHWPVFRAMVERTLTHRHDLPEFQRYATLQHALVGPPRNLITFAVLTRTPFSTAWEMLVERYHRPRLIVNAFLDTLFYLPTITTPDPVRIQAMISKVRECAQALQGETEIAREIGPYNRFFARLVLRKSPPVLRQRFEESYTGHSLPKFREVLDFLQAYCSAAEQAAPPDVSGFSRLAQSE